MIKIGSKLTQEELEQANGGTIKIEDRTYTNLSDNNYFVQTRYRVYDKNDNFIFSFPTLEGALAACEKFGYSKDVIDLRPDASQE